MTTDADGAKSRRRWRHALRALLIAAVVAIYPARRAVEYAAEPSGPKDCPPAEPEGLSPAAGPTVSMDAESLRLSQRGGTINDASCLSRTPVRGIVEVRHVDDVRN